jgi:hypothetical protein
MPIGALAAPNIIFSFLTSYVVQERLAADASSRRPAAQEKLRNRLDPRSKIKKRPSATATSPQLELHRPSRV